VTVFDSVYSGGRDLIYAIHGRTATYYLAADGGATPLAITLPVYEQLGATDDMQTFNLTLRASQVAAPVEGDWIVLDGSTEELVIVNVKSHPNGDFVLRCRNRVART
jgi:hypothetical protein